MDDRDQTAKEVCRIDITANEPYLSIADYMLEAIEQGNGGGYSWVSPEFINSLRAQVDSGKELTENQQQALENIYNKGK